MKYTTLLFACLFSLISLQAQDITFSFDNAVITTEGSNDFYEADIMIESTQDFIVGSGLLYFNYNEAAFGENISANGNLEITHNAQNYICGQKDNVVETINVYGPFVKNDNTESRFAFTFLQAFGSGSFSENNVTATPTKLFHLKIKYIDSGEDPMIEFETAPVFLDQFFTACGSATPLSPADCTSEPGLQLFNDFFDSSQSSPATLSMQTITEISNITVFPNPASDFITIKSANNNPINFIEFYDLLGKLVLKTTSTNTIDVSNFQTGMYLLKIKTEKGQVTKRIVIQ